MTDGDEPLLGAPNMVDKAVPSLRVVGLGKSFGGRPVLSDVALDVPAGQVHALLGENGSGKSTLIKILSGYHTADAGEILVGGVPLQQGDPHHSHRLGCRFVHQDLGLIESMSIADNMSLTAGFPSRIGTVRRRSLHGSVTRDLAALKLGHLDPATPVGALPPVERTGVAVARALHEKAGVPTRVLVLDEPTARLPAAEVRQLLSIVITVAERGVAVVYVTHRLDEVFDVATRVSVLRNGRKTASRAVAALDRSTLVDLLVGREFEEAHSAAVRIGPRDGPPVLHATGLRTDSLTDVEITLRPGEIVGVAGIAGSGRESVLPALFGTATRRAGTVDVDGHRIQPGRPDKSIAAGVAYLPPDRARYGGVLTLTARENLSLADVMSFWRVPFLRRKTEMADVRLWFTRLAIRPNDGYDMPLSTFSGGNQQKVLLSKWLRIGSRVLLLDEPTQGVDIGAKAEIHKHVISTVADGAAALVASSDVDELVALSHRVIVFYGGRIVAELSGPEISVEAVARASVGPGD